MRITKTQIRRIIKEELERVLDEAPNKDFIDPDFEELPDAGMHQATFKQNVVGFLSGAERHSYGLTGCQNGRSGTHQELGHRRVLCR